MVLPGTDGLLSKAQFPTAMITALQRYLIRNMLLLPRVTIENIFVTKNLEILIGLVLTILIGPESLTLVLDSYFGGL